ncbi:hypothetical protein GUITHDRAFT_150245 [Guillardia theta CCMP2712]|uniref:Uncharacterized protein n=1 Tax=Guillardia theta (strain CCMP2712) TaxID=905079 RepID=L1JZM0_GUITC|nr:hypothetical protein GUITHDRAFT_150245 [Guillardia theta CCMP2712]EKX53655.1 hypothetical protein GUITHDRAFT_150245 [Guillardia theta CCMP2712]|eukprot:XP_005840635.1 hypothetical protein GUITHDRAFT_150245 [Guillardia theta CCMP2712]
MTDNPSQLVWSLLEELSRPVGFKGNQTMLHDMVSGQMFSYLDSIGDFLASESILQASFRSIGMRNFRVDHFRELPMLGQTPSNLTTVERIVEIIKHATSRDVGFYFGGFTSALFVLVCVCIGVLVHRRWTVRRKYAKHMSHELEPVSPASILREKEGGDGEA